MAHQPDDLDLKLLTLLVTEPKAGVREYARRLNIARGTAQSRIEKLIGSGAIASLSPHLDPAALGFPLYAHIQLQLKQLQLDAVVKKLIEIPEIIQADSSAGRHDLVCQVVARDHNHLEGITMQMMAIDGIERIQTEVMLRHRIQRRALPLLTMMREELRSGPRPDER